MPSKGVARINGIKYIHVSAMVSSLVSLPTFFLFFACNKKVCFTTGENKLGVETGNDADYGSTCLLTILLILQVRSRQEGARRPRSPLLWQLFVKVLMHAWASQ